MNRRSLIAGAAFVSAASLTACDLTGANVARVRFKVIARALVDGVECEGFAVNEVRARRTPNSLSGFQMTRRIIAEATIVDCGKRASLFVLLTDYLPVLLTLWDIPGPGSADETTIPRLRVADGSREIPRTIRKAPHRECPYYPRIAAFRNEADPASVYQVDPDNLAKTHGPGARFLGLSIEIVDPKTPLTNSIRQRLGWLDPSSGQTIEPLPPRGLPSGSTTFGQVVGHGAFKSEG